MKVEAPHCARMFSRHHSLLSPSTSDSPLHLAAPLSIDARLLPGLAVPRLRPLPRHLHAQPRGRRGGGSRRRRRALRIRAPPPLPRRRDRPLNGAMRGDRARRGMVASLLGLGVGARSAAVLYVLCVFSFLVLLSLVLFGRGSSCESCDQEQDHAELYYMTRQLHIKEMSSVLQ